MNTWQKTVLVIALVVGCVAGAALHWGGSIFSDEAASPSTSSESKNSGTAVNQSSGKTPVTIRNTDIRQQAARSTDTDSPAMIRVNESLVLTPSRAKGTFEGYLVELNTSDPRFKRGDIIISVGGQAVEDSAAGGELLIAALANQNAEVGVLAKTEAPR